MSELIDCIDGLSASDIIKSISKTDNGAPFYLQTFGGNPCGDYSNILINSGGQVGDVLCADDWLDTGAPNGTADDWVQSSGTGSPAIVTGNGFLGNAQRINHVNGTNTFFNQSTGITAELGATYYCSLRYRTDDTAWRMYLRGSADPFILGLPLNVGDAVFWEGTVAATVANQIILRFMGLSGRPSGYLEVDDIVLYKL